MVYTVRGRRCVRVDKIFKGGEGVGGFTQFESVGV